MGALGISKQEGIVSSSYHMYTNLKQNKLSEDFADLLLKARPYIDEYICRSTGIRSSRLRLYPEEFLKIKIILPPLTEQKNIFSHIEDMTSEILQAIEVARNEINLLREFRTRLIADVVTGKLDVREAAAHLPAELDEPEALEALEGDLPDPELDLDTDSDLDAIAEDEAV
jgi:type I restriction enzyme S subunit